MEILELKNVTKTFADNDQHLLALKDIDLKVHQGEVLMLLGPSGSGKSTLLRIMAGLIEPSSGNIIRKPDLTQTFIFQSFALFPWLTVFENVEFGLKMKGMEREERYPIVHDEISRMGLHGFEKSYPHELSGGMKQRVGIARALALKPDIIYLDEPFSALDSFTAKKLRAQLLEFWKDMNLTLVMVTHLIEEAIQLGDRIAVLTQRPAKIDRLFSNHLARPRDTRSEKFFEMSDRIESVIKV